MSIDDRDLRPGMDVYTRDYNYLGTIQRVMPGVVEPPEALITEGARQSSSVSGELRGPVPTLPFGNRGPVTQSAAEGYATEPDSAHLLGDGCLIVTHWWGLRGRYSIPLALIQSFSMEHVILRVDRAEMRDATGNRHH